MKTEIRPLWKDILAAIWLGMVLPGIILQACVLLQRKTPESRQDIQPEKESSARCISLLRSESGICEVLEIDQYLTGVLLAEMPASFEEEALKAQAVAARTYTMKACTTGSKHGNGSVCDSPGCCQGFIAEETYLTRGGAWESIDKVRKAVEETAPLVLEFEGELIEAVYFSSSGGKTESALAVWGADFPYLQSVESPGEEAGDYENRVLSFSLAEFQNLLDLQLTDESESWFSDVTYTDGGGIERMIIAGRAFTGVQLRSLLQLPSTAFSLTTDGKTITAVTKGYGHRVGLSQYGANSMAKRGSTFPVILAHYYPGTVLRPME